MQAIYTLYLQPFGARILGPNMFHTYSIRKKLMNLKTNYKSMRIVQRYSSHRGSGIPLMRNGPLWCAMKGNAKRLSMLSTYHWAVNVALRTISVFIIKHIIILFSIHRRTQCVANVSSSTELLIQIFISFETSIACVTLNHVKFYHYKMQSQTNLIRLLIRPNEWFFQYLTLNTIMILVTIETCNVCFIVLDKKSNFKILIF